MGWRYAVPSAITCASMLIGLAAVATAADGEVLQASWLVILCVLLDKLDGAAARALDATSRFGGYLDSLADFLCFGVAPAFVVERWLRAADSAWLHGPLVMPLRLTLALFVVMTAIRLARFEIDDEANPELDGVPIFRGMPSTFAGGILIVLALVAHARQWPGLLEALPLVALAFAAALVARFPMPKVLARRHRGLQALQLAALAACYVCGLLRVLPELLLVVSATYGLIGLVWGLRRRGGVDGAARAGHSPSP